MRYLDGTLSVGHLFLHLSIEFGPELVGLAARGPEADKDSPTRKRAALCVVDLLWAYYGLLWFFLWFFLWFYRDDHGIILGD